MGGEHGAEELEPDAAAATAALRAARATGKAPKARPQGAAGAKMR